MKSSEEDLVAKLEEEARALDLEAEKLEEEAHRYLEQAEQVRVKTTEDLSGICELHEMD